MGEEMMKKACMNLVSHPIHPSITIKKGRGGRWCCIAMGNLTHHARILRTQALHQIISSLSICMLCSFSTIAPFLQLPNFPNLFLFLFIFLWLIVNANSKQWFPKKAKNSPHDLLPSAFAPKPFSFMAPKKKKKKISFQIFQAATFLAWNSRFLCSVPLIPF